MCEVAGDFDGVGRTAKVWIHPVGTCRQQGMGVAYICVGRNPGLGSAGGPHTLGPAEPQLDMKSGRVSRKGIL